MLYPNQQRLYPFQLTLFQPCRQVLLEPTVVPYKLYRNKTGHQYMVRSMKSLSYLLILKLLLMPWNLTCHHIQPWIKQQRTQAITWKSYSYFFPPELNKIVLKTSSESKNEKCTQTDTKTTC